MQFEKRIKQGMESEKLSTDFKKQLVCNMTDLYIKGEEIKNNEIKAYVECDEHIKRHSYFKFMWAIPAAAVILLFRMAFPSDKIDINKPYDSVYDTSVSSQYSSAVSTTTEVSKRDTSINNTTYNTTSYYQQLIKDTSVTETVTQNSVVTKDENIIVTTAENTDKKAEITTAEKENIAAVTERAVTSPETTITTEKIITIPETTVATTEVTTSYTSETTTEMTTTTTIVTSESATETIETDMQEKVISMWFSDVTGHPGDTVYVDFFINSDEDILAFQVDFTYDSSLFNFSSVSLNEELDLSESSALRCNSEGILIATQVMSMRKDGQFKAIKFGDSYILRFEVEISENTPAGEYKISRIGDKPASAVTADFSTINYLLSASKITVIDN